MKPQIERGPLNAYLSRVSQEVHLALTFPRGNGIEFQLHAELALERIGRYTREHLDYLDRISK